MIICDIVLWKISLYELINIWIPGFIFIFLAYIIGRGKQKIGSGIINVEKLNNSIESIECKIENVESLYIKELEPKQTEDELLKIMQWNHIPYPSEETCSKLIEAINEIHNKIRKDPIYEKTLDFLKHVPILHKSKVDFKTYKIELRCDEIYSILTKNKWEIISCIQTDPTHKFLIIKKKY